MTTLPGTSGTAAPRATALPRAGAGAAPLRSDNARLVQLGLFVAGAVLLPLGLVIICLGWYGIAHTPYEYNQLVYLISGGALGLGVTFIGGFLYFGAWIARVGADLKESDKRLSDTLLILADAIAHASAGTAATPSAGAHRHAGDVLVVAGTSTTVHRADCALLDGRDDLSPAGPGGPGLTACRLCQPLG